MRIQNKLKEHVMNNLLIITLSIFIESSYMLFSTKFFNGINENMTIFEQIGYDYIAVAGLLLINIGLSIAAFFMKSDIFEKRRID